MGRRLTVKGIDQRRNWELSGDKVNEPSADKVRRTELKMGDRSN